MKQIYLLFLLVAACGSAFAQKDPKPGPCDALVSTTLSANGDDKLKVEIPCPVKSFSYQLFNRWGELIYSADKLSVPLDLNIYEKTKEKNQEIAKYPTGVYFWMITYTLIDATEKKMSGSLTIVSAH